jgi:hypothetical protein
VNRKLTALQKAMWEQAMQRADEVRANNRRLVKRLNLGTVAKVLNATLNRAICFSETPLGYLEKFVRKKSEFGIGFSKGFIQKNGGAPIWYLPAKSPVKKVLHNMMMSAKAPDIKDGRRRQIILDDLIWKLCPLVEITRDFGRFQHQFQWEREWRVVSTELKFNVKDVAFLILPEDLHVNARQFFTEARRENLGPAYVSCPYIDGKWNLERYTEN